MRETLAGVPFELGLALACLAVAWGILELWFLAAPRRRA